MRALTMFAVLLGGLREGASFGLAPIKFNAFYGNKPSNER